MESSPTNNLKKRSYYFETVDLVIIALFAALGGVSSAFIGYIGRLFGTIIGLPVGGGQLFSGLHIFWLVLVFLLTNRKVGAVTLTGIIKGFVELFLASVHGIIVIYIAIGEAIVFEAVILGLTFLFQSKKLHHLTIAIAAGFSAASNVFIQLFTYLGAALPSEWFLLILGFSFFSGVGFGGYFGLALFRLFQKSALLNWRYEQKDQVLPFFGKMFQISSLGVFSIMIVVLIGSIMINYQPFHDKYSIDIIGNVQYPFVYRSIDFQEYEMTIIAEQISTIAHHPPQNYTGVPLSIILAKAEPLNHNYTAKIIGSDAYFAIFTSQEIESTPIILSVQETGLRLIAADFPAERWVKQVIRIEIT